MIFLQTFRMLSYSHLEKTSHRVPDHTVQGLGKRMEMYWPVHDMYRMRVPLQGDPAPQRQQFTEMHTLETCTRTLMNLQKRIFAEAFRNCADLLFIFDLWG